MRRRTGGRVCCHQPVAANGEKMSTPPPSPAGDTKRLRFSQNSLWWGVSRVSSDRLASVKADLNLERGFLMTPEAWSTLTVEEVDFLGASRSQEAQPLSPLPRHGAPDLG